MTTAPKFVPDNNTPAAAPPEVPQWSEPMRYDVPQSNGCAGCPRLFVGTKWVGEICGAVYLGHNSVKYAERIVALWNDDIARHAPQPEAQRLAACSCAAIMDTPETHDQNKDMKPGNPFWSPAFDDVLRRTGECIKLRERLAVAMSLLGQCDNRMFLVGDFEVRKAAGGWKLFRPPYGALVGNDLKAQVFVDPVQAALRAKELADVGKVGAA